MMSSKTHFVSQFVATGVRGYQERRAEISERENKIKPSRFLFFYLKGKKSIDENYAKKAVHWQYIEMYSDFLYSQINSSAKIDARLFEFVEQISIDQAQTC